MRNFIQLALAFIHNLLIFAQMATLEEIFDESMKKKRKLLDMAKVKIDNYKDFAKYMDRTPEMKMVPDEVDLEQLGRNFTEFSFVASRKEKFELDSSLINPSFIDAMPPSMKDVRMEDLLSVDIHWKMLTDLRPVNRNEEDYFQRIVEMGKLCRSTKSQEEKMLAASMSNVPGSTAQAKSTALGFYTTKSRRGTPETRIRICRECGLELCSGALCKLGNYEFYHRVILDKDELEAEDAKGFSLKAVIAQANAKPDLKADEKKVRERRERKKGPSLKALLVTSKTTQKRKRKKKTKRDNPE